MISLKMLLALMFCPTSEDRMGLPGLLWGPPGAGKTPLIAAFCRMLGIPYFRLSPGEQGEGRFGVVPVPTDDGQYLRYPVPEDLAKTFEGAQRGVLFVDEINTAAPALQAPLLGLVQLGVLGSYKLPAGVWVLGASNETQDAAGGWDLAPALRNRFGHFSYEGLDAEEWCSALLSGFRSEEVERVDIKALETHVTNAWPEADALARGLVSGFIRARPELLHKQPARGAKDSKAWPSRRTCEYAATVLASSKVHGLSESDTDVLLSGFVSMGWVTEFRTWSKHLDLPNPADFLDGKAAFKHDDKRLDRTIVVLNACAALVTPEKAVKREARAEALWKLIGAVSDDSADIILPAARQMMKASPRLYNPNKGAAKDIFHKIYPLMEAAGITAAKAA